MTSLQTKNRRLITFLLITGIIIGYLLNEGKRLVFPSNDKVTIDSLQVVIDSFELRHGYDSVTIIAYKRSDSAWAKELQKCYGLTNGVVMEKKVKR